MKKAYFIGALTMIVITGGLISCKKEGQCYSCTYGVHNGYQKPADTYCCDIGKYAPKAADGADLSFFCKAK